MYTPLTIRIYRRQESEIAAPLTSIRVDKKLADKAVRVLGVKTRTEAVHRALEEVVKLKEFKDPLKKYVGKLKFGGSDE